MTGSIKARIAASPRPCRSIRGWGVSARLIATSEELLNLGLLSLPRGFKAFRSRGSGPRFDLRARGPYVEFSENDQVRFVGRSRKALRMAVADAFETLASIHSRTFAFLHAGGVEVEGRVIVLPGRSHAGKSTLVAAFLDRGARYLSDDMIPIDRTLLAHPFPRPMGIRKQTGSSPQRTPIERMGGAHADRPLPLAMVWSGTYDPSRTRPTFNVRKGGRAFAELLAQSPGARVQPRVVVPILSEIARTVPVYTGVRGEAGEMVTAILARLQAGNLPGRAGPAPKPMMRAHAAPVRPRTGTKKE
jgi:hypothetical protein